MRTALLEGAVHTACSKRLFKIVVCVWMLCLKKLPIMIHHLHDFIIRGLKKWLWSPSGHDFMCRGIGVCLPPSY